MRWLVEVGDVVAVDQPVVEVETAKAMVEVPCPYGGVVTARFGEEGTELPVGAPLLTVAVGGGPGAATARAPARPGRRRAGSPGPARGLRQRAGRLRHGRARGAGAGGAAGRAGGRGHGAAPAAAAGAAPRPAARPPLRRRRRPPARRRPSTARRRGPVPVISPLVRRLARENGLDLRELTGSGPDGLILRADVERALRGRPPRPAGPRRRAGPARVPAPRRRRAGRRAASPCAGVRGAVADKLSRSRREIPDATCWVDADATELMRGAGGDERARAAPKISAPRPARPDLHGRAGPLPRAQLHGGHWTAREIVRLPDVHLGFAAQTDRGLVVPVVRDAHAAARRVAERGVRPADRGGPGRHADARPS